MSEPQRSRGISAEAIRDFLAARTPGVTVSVRDLRTMTGGATREVWRLDCDFLQPDGSQQSQALVLIAFRPYGQRSFSPAQEVRLLETLYAAGVPVPRPFLMGDSSLGQQFYLIQRVEGETIGRRIVREPTLAGARRNLPAQLGEALAKIHATAAVTDDLSFLPRPPTAVSAVDHAIDSIESLYRQAAVEPHPAFELALRWLRRNRPARREITLVHGDFRIGNVIVGEEGLRAVLDWELAHLGDPLEDLGWMCVRSWRFGADTLPVGGVGTRESFFAAYAAASGRPIDPQAVRFWEIYGNLRWGVFTLLQLRAFLDGLSSSVELASIGRRTAETELELLNLMEGA